MKFTTTAVSRTPEILYNDHYVAIPYDCSAIEANEQGIIPAGTIIPANDATAIGVLLSDVVKDENPNGTIVLHGFIRNDKLPEGVRSAAWNELKHRVVFIDPVYGLDVIPQ